MQTGSRNSAALKAHDRHEQSTSLINMHQSQQKPTEVSDVDFKKYVLYVSGGKEDNGQEHNSRKPLCIKTLESLKLNTSLKMDTLIIYADDLLTRPAWLSQLPCLVFKEEKKALSGEACLSYLNSSDAKEYKSNLRMYNKRRNFGHENCWKV
jgi:hypothetical protein